jgi:hypothetical protein
MPAGNVPNYQGAEDGQEIIRDGFNVYVKVYNDLTAAVTNGDVYFLSYEKDADSLDPSVRPTLVACATTTTTGFQHIAVVNNKPLGKGTIADQEYGYVQIRGYCPDVKTTTATEAAENFIQGTNGTQAATTDSTAKTLDSFAIMIVTAVANHGACMMFGDPAWIG